MLSESAQQGLAILRDTSNISWHIVPMLLVVFYVYFNQIDQGNWRRVFAAFAFIGMDLFNEIINGLVFRLSDFAPIWGAPGNNTSLLILIGLNIEIVFMFAITGICATLALPKDKNSKILGINNRFLLAVIFSLLSVFTEILLNKADMLTWEWAWWNADFPVFIFLCGYLPFYLVCYKIYDLPTQKQQLTGLSIIYGVNISALIIFGALLGWL